MKTNLNTLCLISFLFLSTLHCVYPKTTGYNTTIDAASNNNLKPKQTFLFGSKKTKDKGILISSPLQYNSTLGYGFDFDTAANINVKADGISAVKGFYFSVKLAEGNYKIKVTVGSPKKATNTTIKAESRRLMLKELPLKKGTQKEIMLNVNLRSVNINKTSSIQLKTREVNTLNWDDKLSLEFLGDVAIQKIEIEKTAPIKTLFLAGDSTVADQDLEPWASWGQFITAYLNTTIVVANYASSGASLSSFKSRKRLDKILSQLQNEDIVIIEFGHNDEKQKGKDKGPWLSYTNSLKAYITKIRAKGGIPILVTPTQRRLFNNQGQLINTHGEFPEAMRKVATDFDVPLIDLTKMTTALYESWGIEDSKKGFVHYPANTFHNQTRALKDNTHFNSFGANEIARCIVKGIRDLNLNLTDYLKVNVSIYNPRKPNNFSSWTLPMSLRFENTKPEGN
ncbi:MAG: rhamnogalacturonan acetylesterase [Winogradskyella sp.]|uniref:rhamnogalacturonan acetylesterase n=1 Tax=Winogradskyella sp. TaxID=1883156 RepID=UPI00385B62CC